MTSPASRVSDEIAGNVLHAFLFGRPPERSQLEHMRLALEAVWPEPMFTHDEVQKLRRGLRVNVSRSERAELNALVERLEANGV